VKQTAQGALRQTQLNTLKLRSEARPALLAVEASVRDGNPIPELRAMR
jgi:hypothetical protein